MKLWAAVAIGLRMGMAMKVALMNESAYFMMLAAFNTTTSRDTFALDLSVALDTYPVALDNAFLFLRMCPQKLLDAYATSRTYSSGLLAYDAALCFSANPFGEHCNSYPLQPQTAHRGLQYIATLQLSGPFQFNAGENHHILLLDACALFFGAPNTLPRISGALEFVLCKSTEFCIPEGGSFQLAAVYLTIALFWALLVCLWMGNIFYFRKVFTTLQQRMLLVPLAECIYMVMVYVASDTSDSLSSALTTCTVCCRILSLGVAANEILLIAHGWKITRDDLRPHQYIQYRLLSLCWAISLAIIQYTDDTTLLVLLFWGSSWTCLVYMVWYHSALNISILRIQMDMISSVYIDPSTTPVNTKLRLFKAFRRCLVVYFVAVFIVDIFLTRYLAATLTSIIPIVLEALYIIFCIGIGITFRCRQFNPIFYVTFPVNHPPIAPAPQPTSEAPSMQPWHEGIGLPNVPMHIIQNRRRSVVIQSPADHTGLGTATVPQKAQETQIGRQAMIKALVTLLIATATVLGGGRGGGGDSPRDGNGYRVQQVKSSLYIVNLASANDTHLAHGASVAVQLNVTIANIPAPLMTSPLFLHICPSSILYNILMNPNACRSNVNFNSDCVSYELDTKYLASQWYSAAVAFSDILSSRGGEIDIVFLLDACAVFIANPLITPQIQATFQWFFCDDSSVCIGQTRLPLAIFYTWLTSIWACLIVLWAANIIYHRSVFTLLQRRMLLVPIAECIYMLLTCLKYGDSKDISSTMEHIIITSRVISLAVAAHETLLIAHGWKITRDEVSIQQSIQYRVIAFVWAITLTIIQISERVSLMIFVTWALSWMALVYIIWFHSGLNITLLKMHLHLISNAHIRPETTPVYSKLSLFTIFRRLIVGYFAAVLAVDLLVSHLLPATMYNLMPIIQEGLYIIFCLGIGITFRCREFNPIFYVTFPERVPAIAPMPPPTNTTQDGELQVWQQGMSLPAVPAHVLHNKPRAVVVIQSPGQETGLGTK